MIHFIISKCAWSHKYTALFHPKPSNQSPFHYKANFEQFVHQINQNKKKWNITFAKPNIKLSVIFKDEKKLQLQILDFELISKLFKKNNFLDFCFFPLVKQTSINKQTKLINKWWFDDLALSDLTTQDTFVLLTLRTNKKFNFF